MDAAVRKPYRSRTLAVSTFYKYTSTHILAVTRLSLTVPSRGTRHVEQRMQTPHASRAGLDDGTPPLP